MGAAGGCRLQQARRWRAVGDDGEALVSENAGLLAADVVPVAAQPVLVVEPDVGDERGIGTEDVHRIEPAAQADFQHLHLDSGLAEQPECRQRAELEIAERHALLRPRHLDGGKGPAQRGVIRRQTIDRHALVVAVQMG